MSMAFMSNACIRTLLLNPDFLLFTMRFILRIRHVPAHTLCGLCRFICIILGGGLFLSLLVHVIYYNDLHIKYH